MTELGGLAKFGALIVFAGFLSDWLSVIFGWKKFRPYAKTLALILLILWIALLFDFAPNRLGVLLLLALGFGLLGDILLLFPTRCFKWGLGAFLLGHITYLFLFYKLFQIGRVEGLIAPIAPWVWGVIGVVVLAALMIFNRVIIRKIRDPHPRWLFQVALYLYAVCLSVVMVSGWLTAGLYTSGGIWIWALALGGTSFLISDFNLAYDRFVKPFKPAHFLIMVTYHLAQFFLAIGFFMLISRF